jgi:secondary thiamine-phosphate synthase enzyme
MAQQNTFSLPPRSKGFHLITKEVVSHLGELPASGVLHLFIQHTSAAIAIGENADHTVRRDLDASFDRLAPEGLDYEHDAEGSDDMPAHVKTIIAGNSVSIPVTAGRLNLGTWQGIYLCEFREHATSRTLVATVLG